MASRHVWKASASKERGGAQGSAPPLLPADERAPGAPLGGGDGLGSSRPLPCGPPPWPLCLPALPPRLGIWDKGGRCCQQVPKEPPRVGVGRGVSHSPRTPAPWGPPLFTGSEEGPGGNQLLKPCPHGPAPRGHSPAKVRGRSSERSLPSGVRRWSKAPTQEAQQSRNDLGMWDWPARDDPEVWRQHPGRGSGVLKAASSDSTQDTAGRTPRAWTQPGDQPDARQAAGWGSGAEAGGGAPSRQSKGPRQG